MDKEDQSTNLQYKNVNIQYSIGHLWTVLNNFTKTALNGLYTGVRMGFGKKV